LQRFELTVIQPTFKVEGSRSIKLGSFTFTQGGQAVFFSRKRGKEEEEEEEEGDVSAAKGGVFYLGHEMAWSANFLMLPPFAASPIATRG